MFEHTNTVSTLNHFKCFQITVQKQIQDFLQGDANPKGGGVMEIKKIGPNAGKERAQNSYT